MLSVRSSRHRDIHWRGFWPSIRKNTADRIQKDDGRYRSVAWRCVYLVFPVVESARRCTKKKPDDKWLANETPDRFLNFAQELIIHLLENRSWLCLYFGSRLFQHRGNQIVWYCLDVSFLCHKDVWEARRNYKNGVI